MKENRMTLRLPDFMEKKLEEEIKKTGESKSTIVRTAILQYFKE